METLTCPRCGGEMDVRVLGTGADVARCPDGHGVFLAAADLGSLVEAEVDWHAHAVQHTAPMPRITADMAEPPTPKLPARAWVETLF